MKRLLSLLALVASMLVVLPALAQTPPDPTPWAGHCFDQAKSYCVLPELSFDVFKYNLKTKVWTEGEVPVGAGYVFLAGYGQWWASGVAAHLVLNLSQGSSTPNEADISITATIFNYVHFGASVGLFNGYEQWSLVGGLNIPMDLLTTGTIQSKKLAYSRWQAQQAPQSPPKP